MAEGGIEALANHVGDSVAQSLPCQLMSVTLRISE
jgi:hypothetical protein